MANLTQIRPRSQELEAALIEAAEHVNECDGVLVIMQKKSPNEGLLYYHNKDMRLETTVWYLSSLLFRIHSAAGKE
jgi:hypothetical protein